MEAAPHHVATRVLAVDGQQARLEPINGGEIEAIPADLVVFVSLNRPRDELAELPAQRKLSHQLIGDANTPRFLVRAITEGHAAARSL